MALLIRVIKRFEKDRIKSLVKDQINCHRILHEAEFAQDNEVNSCIDHYFSAENTVLLVAEEGSEIKGYLVGVRQNGFAEIEDIFISEKSRREGIASALIRGFEEMMEKDKIRDFRVEVDSTNASALEFWVSLGFDRLDALILEKREKKEKIENIEIGDVQFWR